MRPLLYRPGIRALLNGVVKRVPVLHRRLRSLAEQEGLVAPPLITADVPVSVSPASVLYVQGQVTCFWSAIKIRLCVYYQVVDGKFTHA